MPDFIGKMVGGAVIGQCEALSILVEEEIVVNHDRFPNTVDIQSYLVVSLVIKLGGLNKSIYEPRLA